MSKPNTMLDLLSEDHIGLNEINTIARAMFNDATTMAGPEGYLVTGVNFDDLPEHVQGFIRKAILKFTIENVIDAREPFTIDGTGEAECAQEPSVED